MFSRASQKLHTCLRCQNRTNLFRRHFAIVVSPPWQTIAGSIRRWNSSVAAVKEERDGDDADDVVDTRTIDRRSEHLPSSNKRSEILRDESEGAGQLPFSDPDVVDDNVLRVEQEESRSPSGVRYKHWRPTKATKLDVKFLGKPGEILVLPESERKKKRRDAEEIEEEDNAGEEEVNTSFETPQRESVYDSLRNQQRPLTNEEIMGIIDTFRQTLPLGGTQILSIEQILSIRKSLEKAFNKTQLETYVRSSPKIEEPLPLKTARRIMWADYILQHIWCLYPVERGWIIHAESPARSLIQLLKQKPGSNLEGAVMTSSGFKGTNEYVYQRLKKLVDGYTAKHVTKPKILASETSLSPEQSLVQSWARSRVEYFARAGSILLKPTKAGATHYQAYAFSAAALRNFTRELYLVDHEAHDFLRTLRPIKLAGRHNAFLPVIERGLTYGGAMHLRSKTHESILTFEKGGNNKDLVDRIQENLLGTGLQVDACEELAIKPELRKRISTTIFAEFGKVGTTMFGTGPDDRHIQNTFSPQVAFLPQILSQQKILNQSSKKSKSTAQSSISRLLYKPRYSSNLPYLEVFAEFDQSNSILIHQVNLLFPPRQEIVKGQIDTNDICFNYQERLGIFETSNASVNDQLAPLIGGIAQQLPFVHETANMYEPGNLSVDYFLKLNLSQLSSAPSVKKHVIMYALDTCQIVHSSFYDFPSDPNLLLEFRSCTPTFKSLLSAPSQRSQTLRLVERSSLKFGRDKLVIKGSRKDYIGRSNTILSTFVEKAHDMSSEIHTFSEAERHRLMSQYPALKET